MTIGEIPNKKNIESLDLTPKVNLFKDWMWKYYYWILPFICFIFCISWLLFSIAPLNGDSKKGEKLIAIAFEEQKRAKTCDVNNFRKINGGKKQRKLYKNIKIIRINREKSNIAVAILEIIGYPHIYFEFLGHQ